MMKFIGRAPQLLLLAFIVFYTNAATAAVVASVDRNRISLGDTLRLTITTTDGEEISEIDFRPLMRDWKVLQRSTNSSMNWSTSGSTHTKQLIIDLTPLREGDLQIPSLRVEHETTSLIPILVAKAPAVNTGGQSVLFEAEVDSTNVYVQGQILLTLRIQQAINLNARNITELEIEHAFVKPLEQSVYNRTIDGRAWQVLEVRYAIFPEQSGLLNIPAQTFSGRLIEGRRSMFNQNNGRLLRRTTNQIQINVKPRPDSFTGNNWLPARQVVIKENWSTPPEQLRAGESATRTISLQGEGVLGAQLPPVLLEPSDGLKFYPDQPAIAELEVSSGLLGSREDSTAVVPTRAGNWTLPEVRIPWWDTNTDRIRYAVLPARDITVAAADPATTSAPVVPAGIVIAEGVGTGKTAEENLLWKVVSAVSIALWLITLYALLSGRRTKKPVVATTVVENVSEKSAFKKLLAACKQNNAPATRAAAIAWGIALTGNNKLTSLDNVADIFSDADLGKELAALDASLYSTDANSWQGESLGSCVTPLRETFVRSSKNKKGEALRLYPL
ncbi:MAG: hypothetical protein ACI9JM_003192 [Halioglobus sp.]|jgi:hypothetical protein